MSAERRAFAAEWGPAVARGVRGSGVFTSVALAQLIIESGGGRDLLATAYHNLFGIKAGAGWSGPRVALSTPKDGQPVSYFRVYGSAAESVRDYVRFLRENPRYAAAGVFAAATPEAQALALGRSGYAENASYAQLLIGVIRDNELARYDRLNAAATAGTLVGLSALAGGLYYYRRELLQLTRNLKI